MIDTPESPPQSPYNERAGLPSVATRPHIAEDAPSGNGTHDEDEDAPVRLDSVTPRVTASSARRIPQTREWVRFSEAYSFMEVKVWTDAPAKVMEGLGPQTGDETTDDVRRRVLDTLGRLVLAHRFDDGTPWTDDEGELPPPQDALFWDRAPQPIVNAIVDYIRKRIADHPTLRRSGATPKR